MQINLGHRAAAHDALMHWLFGEADSWIICIQEPYFTKKGISQLPRQYGAFWHTQGNESKRAVIIAPRRLDGYMITQHSNGDCVVIRFDKLQISVVSIYCGIEKEIEKSIQGLLKEAEVRDRIVCGMDANAYHKRWGSVLWKKSKWKAKVRGEELVQYIDEAGLVICNEPPHPPTFIRDSGKCNTSHVDVTICSSKVYSNITEWQVRQEMFGSDHCSITCRYMLGSNVSKYVPKQFGVPWKKPSSKMKKVMEDALCNTVKGMDNITKVEEVETVIGKHIDMVREVLEGVFKKHERKGMKVKVYWWTEAVDKVYLSMRKARRRMRQYKYYNLKEEFYESRREFRRTVREEKLKAWKKFTSEISEPWDKLIKIVKASMTGKVQDRTLMDITGRYACDMKETLFILGRQFFPVPIPKLSVHINIENEVMNKLHDVIPGPYITLCEFRQAISEMSRATAPGFDKITNNVIQIMATKGKLEKKYLKMFNVCLKNAYFPASWKKAKVVLIPKNTTDTNSTKAFRPISLTSSYSKLFERIILARLIHYLSLSKVMTKSQHAYRKGASTQTALYDLFSVVQQALNKRGGGICVAVFLDISGAFDCTWHFGILYKLLMYGVPNYLVAWIKCFLEGRSAYLSEGGEEHKVDLEQGCPQGGVLSPILWNVLFNELLDITPVKGISKIDTLKVIGYADDAAIICRAKTEEQAFIMINEQLRMIHEWAVLNRVKFNSAKLATMMISNKLNRPKPVAVYYNNILVQEVTTYKYLGLNVDNKLKWNVHIDGVLNKLAIVTKSLRGLSQGSWGINLEIYRLLFHSIFMPVMLYGIGIWGWRAASVTVCHRFDKEIRRFGLMATRCQRSTSNMYLFQLLKVMPFSKILQFEVLKVSVQQFHVTQSNRKSVYENYESSRIRRIVPQCMDQVFHMYRKDIEKEICDVEFADVDQQYFVHPAKWVSTKCIVHEDMIRAIWNGADKRGWIIFTDASASSYGIGWGYVAYRHGICKTVRNGALTKCSIFMAEAYALLQAVKYANTIEGLGKREIVEIRSDSQGLVKSLRNNFHEDSLLCKIKEILRDACHAGKNIQLCWVPSHKDVSGNEQADMLAKKGVDSRAVSYMPIIKRDALRVIGRKKREAREDIWDLYDGRTVKLFLPDIGKVDDFLKSAPSVSLCQLVSGHTRLNEFVYRVLKLRRSAYCECGEAPETVEHFLFVCNMYKELREEIWEDFEPTFSYITKDWSKLNEFVIKTGRFERSIKDNLFLQGEDRGL